MPEAVTYRQIEIALPWQCCAAVEEYTESGNDLVAEMMLWQGVPQAFQGVSFVESAGFPISEIVNEERAISGCVAGEFWRF